MFGHFPLASGLFLYRGILGCPLVGLEILKTLNILHTAFFLRILAFWIIFFFDYLRGAPIWFFNFENGDFNIPLGLGAGKVIQTRKVVYNFFLEPQYIVASEGNGQPEWQLYFALNLQIKK